MNVQLTQHARARIADRGYYADFSEADILYACDSASARFPRSGEVLVIVKSLGRMVITPDGSKGDTVVAAVDCSNGNIKTVELSGAGQIARRRAMGIKRYVRP